MSRSYRTEKRSRLAEARIRLTADGEIDYPRVIARKPRRGDSHPVPKNVVQNFMQKAPIEYLYGLDRIELRARQSKEVGRPFGYYIRDEKAIVLYSLPMKWSWQGISARNATVKRMLFYHAEVTERDGVLDVEWPDVDLRMTWFYIEVLAHEFGHHHRNQYRPRNRRAARRHEEIIAAIHSERFYKAALARIKSQRAGTETT